MGVNVRLDEIISDRIFTNRLTLMRLSMDNLFGPLAPRKLDRFCSEILPQIGEQVISINVDAFSMERVLLAGKYSNLFGLGIYNITEKKFQQVLLDGNPLSNVFKNQISCLVVSIGADGKRRLADEVSTALFGQILDVLTNLRSLIFDSPFSYECDQCFSFGNTSPTLFSPTLVELHVNVTCFKDCLHLLDGRFNQLRVFHVKISCFGSTRIIENQKELPNLRNLSFSCYMNITSYEESLLPLLQRMISLEKLSLDIMCHRQSGFIDGNDLKNMIDHFVRLNQFTFHIRSIIFCDFAIQYPTNEQIQDTLTDLKEYQITSSVDYFLQQRMGQCHIYSNPYTMDRYDHIANHFPDGLFKSVRKITLFDERSFEYLFFLKIAQAFPLVVELSLENHKAQQDKKYQESNDNNEDFPVIRYARLKKLDLIDVHQDYLHMFLDHTITSLPNRIVLSIKYTILRKVTEHFTNDRMRINCGKVRKLWIYGKFDICEDFKRYFPHVEQFGRFCS